MADPSRRTYLDVSGVVSAADVYVNGVQVATKERIAGAYTQHELDVTDLVRAGTNTVAFRVQPNDPRKNLTMGWIDWLQPPPDENMGIVRDVLVRRGGPVALRDAHVTTRLDTESLASAELTVKARVRNDSTASVTATVSGTAGPAAISRTVSLAPHETKAVTFAPPTSPSCDWTGPRCGGPPGWATSRCTTSTSPPPSRALPPTPPTTASASAMSRRRSTPTAPASTASTDVRC
ncbi:hypothetical protein SVIO_096580 [Streptomyces violaceusniger]|uniref:Beta-mannosidase-like galactose-binding domain-containing protein n=1 Tax=Streptomyces violaceusniger TaxID=68280 RepID=A0A4D4LD51_STRVO|nr:hypothetical protein SVIO_096580 [Streptomyces violaceusniger]